MRDIAACVHVSYAMEYLATIRVVNLPVRIMPITTCHHVLVSNTHTDYRARGVWIHK